MSQDFPTYGRGGDEPPEQPEEHPPVPPAERYGDQPRYGDPRDQRQNTYGDPYPQPYQQQFGQGQYGPYGAHAPGQYGQNPYQSYGQGQPPPSPYQYPPQGQPPYQPLYQQPGPGQPQNRTVDPNPAAAKVALIAGIVTAFYGLLVLTVQRTALREIAQAPGSELNHPLRTDVIDTIGQIAAGILTAIALTLWIRDVLNRRRQGRWPAVSEYVGFGLIGLGAIFVLIWFLMIASTGFGSDDSTTGRLPAAYGYGGFGLLLVAAGLFTAYRVLRPDMQPVIQSAPVRPPWE
jgi:hypothetical protein